MGFNISKKRTPIILTYVNDRDLWLNKELNYEEVFDGLTLEEKTVENWNKLIFNSNINKFQEILNNGITIRKYVNKQIKHLETKTYQKTFIFNNKKYNVIYCNSPILQSDLGNYLVNNYPVDFAAIYHFNGYNTIFSLRGKDKINLSEIAKKYNGGGHFNAAGCNIEGNVISL